MMPLMPSQLLAFGLRVRWQQTNVDTFWVHVAQNIVRGRGEFFLHCNDVLAGSVLTGIPPSTDVLRL